MLAESELNKIRVLFESLSAADFAALLAAELADCDRLGNFNLEFFSRVVGAERVRETAALALAQLQEFFLGSRQKLRKKIEFLISSLTDSAFIEPYYAVFSPYLENIPETESSVFDRQLIHTNYRLILLDLLSLESDKGKLEPVLKETTGELKKMREEPDFGYLEALADIAAKKKTEGLENAMLFDEIDKEMTGIIEHSLWDKLPPGYCRLIEYPSASVIGIDAYLEKMLGEGRINDVSLKLFARLFPGELRQIYDYLQMKGSDIEFTEKIISILKGIDPELALPVLEGMYPFSNNYIKIELIKTMRELHAFRREFLFSIALKDDIPLRKEAMLALMEDKGARREILEKLFCVSSPWQVNGARLLSHLNLIDELGLREARSYLIALNGKLFFWHRPIKQRIREILDKWKQ